MVLNDNVSLTVRKGARDVELSKLTTQLVLGDDRQETTATYNVVLGKYSSINDQGVFRGRGLISLILIKIVSRQPKQTILKIQVERVI